MTDHSLDDLDADLYPLCLKWLDECSAAGLKVKVLVTYRSAADQNEAKAKGLSNAGAGQSPHNCTDDEGNPASCAFDFGCFTPESEYITDGREIEYTQAGQIAKGLGLVWGGDFHSFPDYDHIETKDWRL